MIQQLPKECFECESVNKDNYKLFIIDNAVVLPDNILSVEDKAFRAISEQIYFIHGNNVQIIGESAFQFTKNIRSVRFPNLLEIKDGGF